MLEKRAIIEIPLSTDSGGWRPILNLKAFNRYVYPADCDGLHMGGSPTLEECFRTLEELPNIRDMSSLYQFERRLFSRPRDTRAHKISSLCLRPESVQIPNAPLRSLYSPKGIHKGRKSKGTRGEYAPVPRLAP